MKVYFLKSVRAFFNVFGFSKCFKNYCLTFKPK